MEKPINILVANDDGITAPGIRALVEVAVKLGEVTVVAPDKPQSGTGHGITINDSIRIAESDIFGKDVKAYSCSGTPVDCVKMAMTVIMDEKPDIVLSGINHGSNSSINVIYSGTMSAAVEAALEGIPAIGFSLLDHGFEADFSGTQHYATTIIKQVLEHGLQPWTCLNVNVPKLKKEELMGIKICRQAKGYWKESFDKRTDPMGKDYYWLSGHFEDLDPAENTDEHALSKGYISIVPVHCDLTGYDSIEKLKKWKLDV